MLEYLNSAFDFGYVEIVIFLAAAGLVLRTWIGARGDTYFGLHFDGFDGDADGGDGGCGD